MKHTKLVIRNKRVVVFSALALCFLVLAFTVSPYFVIGAIVLMLVNQKELFGMNSKKK